MVIFELPANFTQIYLQWKCYWCKRKLWRKGESKVFSRTIALREGGKKEEGQRGGKGGREEGMGREMHKEEAGRDRLENKIHASASSAQ